LVVVVLGPWAADGIGRHHVVLVLLPAAIQVVLRILQLLVAVIKLRIKVVLRGVAWDFAILNGLLRRHAGEAWPEVGGRLVVDSVVTAIAGPIEVAAWNCRRT
jgi:hypothetical protein